MKKSPKMVGSGAGGSSYGLLTPEEIGEVYQVSGRTVRDWFHAGLIPAEVAAGRVFRFDLERVREALAANAEKVRARCGPEYAEVI